MLYVCSVWRVYFVFVKKFFFHDFLDLLCYTFSVVSSFPISHSTAQFTSTTLWADSFVRLLARDSLHHTFDSLFCVCAFLAHSSCVLLLLLLLFMLTCIYINALVCAGIIAYIMSSFVTRHTRAQLTTENVVFDKVLLLLVLLERWWRAWHGIATFFSLLVVPLSALGSAPSHARCASTRARFSCFPFFIVASSF